MEAHVGDWVVIEGRMLGERRRQGQIIGITHSDGTPPYRVRWLEDDHESVVFPGPGARIEPHPVPPATGPTR